jgi:hypothetical protein
MGAEEVSANVERLFPHKGKNVDVGRLSVGFILHFVWHIGNNLVGQISFIDFHLSSTRETPFQKVLED